MSIRYEEKPCECGSHYIQNRTKWKCPDCIYKLNHGGKTKQEVALEKTKQKPVKIYKIKRKVIKKKPKKKTGEYELFLEIWGEREHECHNCKMSLDGFIDRDTGNPSASLFMHMTSKGADCRKRLKKKNIKLGCPECHDAYDFIGREAFKKRKNLHKHE